MDSKLEIQNVKSKIAIQNLKLIRYPTCHIHCGVKSFHFFNSEFSVVFLNFAL
jgi:hypothetical protein